jgi:hypothetical protein
LGTVQLEDVKDGDKLETINDRELLVLANKATIGVGGSEIQRADLTLSNRAFYSTRHLLPGPKLVARRAQYLFNNLINSCPFFYTIKRVERFCEDINQKYGLPTMQTCGKRRAGAPWADL